MPGANLDHAVLLFARTRGHTPAAERVVSAYSRLGEHGACWIVLGVAGSLVDGERRRRRAWRRGAAVVVLAYGVNQAVKFAVRRPRPQLDGLPPLTPTITKLSFPSAHATTAFAAARAYSRLASAGVLYAAAGLFALSRPYLGVHYPTDVLAGAVLGTALGELTQR